ncbi:MAG: chorismate mutase [Bacteroidales bacterium]
MEVTTLQEWLGTDEPLIVSGPCSAESYEQVMQTAIALRKIPEVRIFRSGVWKPRTRPKSFEGVGSEALLWLKDVRKETGLLTAVEVASAQHVEEAVDSGVDVVWLGARTVVNPFMVNDICKALKGTDIPVLVKNPLHPDINLWIGAMERLNNVGITKIVAVHRGFFCYQNTEYRNQPMWEVVIELKRRFPNLPIINDPSHIGGKRSLLLQIAQKAFDLELSGLMVETHVNPDEALTDSQQQITPEQLADMLSKIVYRKGFSEDKTDNKIELLRQEIDKLDAELLDILNKRFDIIKEIGVYKKENNITILQIDRWRQMFKNRLDMAQNMGYDSAFIKSLINIIHEESIRLQEDIFNDEDI